MSGIGEIVSSLAAILMGLQVAAAPLLSQEFSGQVGRIDEAMLGEDWWRIQQGQFPILPVEGVRVSVLDCEPDCPDPVVSDPAGYFRFAELSSPAWLRFDPAECEGDGSDCEPLQPREVERQSGARTALGHKWPDLVVDLMQRFMPSVADALYVKREGDIPTVTRASGAASNHVIWINGRGGWDTIRELSIFMHELMHVFERRLKRDCVHEHLEVEGYVLQESWLQAHDADRDRMAMLGIELREPDGYEWEGYKRGLETLAEFAEMYLIPDHMSLERQRRFPLSGYMTHAELEEYAPNRIDWFERMLYGRSVDRRSFFQANPHAETWPGKCAPPERLAWALERLPPLPQLSKSESEETKPLEDFKCGFLDLPLW